MRNYVTRSRVALFGLALILALGLKAIAAGPPTPRPSSSPPALAAPTTTAPAKPAVTRTQASQTKPSTAVPAASNDAAIERAIQARFARSKISTNGFTVRVQAGVAILEGKTGVIQHKGTATRLAKRAGARRVDNRIQISEAARQRAVANLSRAHD
jgi:BON domain